MEQTISLFRTRVSAPALSNSSPEVTGKGTADTLNISISSRRVVTVLTLSTFALLAVHFAVMFADIATGENSAVVSKLIKAFSVDEELNIPAWFSSLILLFASVLLAVVTYLKQRAGERYVFHWAVLAGGFFFMSFDEIASVHEKLIEPMKGLIGPNGPEAFHFGWVVPAIALVAVLGITFLRFWWRLPKKVRLWTLVAALVYLGGTVGMELVGGKYAATHGKSDLTYRLIASLEETMEMTGTILFIKILLEYIADCLREVTVKLGFAGDHSS
jgi:hypothetical protein